MPDTHRFIIDRHEGDLAVVEVDGRSLLDVPRWPLPHAARPDDVLGVTVDAGPERTVVTIVRDAEASARARAEAGDGGARLKRRGRGRRGGRGPTDRPADRSTATAGDGGWRRVWPVPVPAQGQFGRRGPESVLDPTRLHQRGRQILGRPPNACDG